MDTAMKKMLIVGYGDIARRATPALLRAYELYALVRGEASYPGIKALRGDLDDPESLKALRQDWDAVLHLAPPGTEGQRDERTRALIACLNGARILPRRLLYFSTSGVYGDCAGAQVDETRPLQPQTARAKRRADAEGALREWFPGTIVLRVPGIYAADRLPLERIRAGTPVLRDDDDVYTNHIHAEDLAAVCVKALEQAPSGAIYNVSDDSELKMGQWFDLVAARHGLPQPPRVTRAEAARLLPPPLYSFMCESRRLVNGRMKAELAIRLAYPTVMEGLR
jgi:nucleoside-diphosphate-sugar epimerase